MVTLNQGEPGKGVTLAIDGEATISQASEIRGKLMEALGTGEGVAVDARGVTACDLSFIQILHAHCLGRHQACGGVRWSESVHRTMEEAGIPTRGIPGCSAAHCPFVTGEDRP